MTARSQAVDIAELARFIVTGVTATLGNLGVVWIARHFLSFQLALAPGVATGFLISFALSKVFAFRSKSWDGAGGEMGRFIVVYLFGCICYWGVAVVVGRLLSKHGFAPAVSETAGVLMAAGTMMVTSYFGHRFFTYRSFERALR